LLLGVAVVHAEEPLKKIVDAAIAEELSHLRDIEERFEKGKLKPAESVLLFGKKTLSKEKRLEKLNELRIQVEAGEVSFRTLSLDLDHLKIGQAGVLVKPFQRIYVTGSEDTGNEFYGYYSTPDGFGGRPHRSNDFTFRNVPGGEELVSGKAIVITVPLLVAGRQSDTFVLESLASCIKKVREQEAKKKK